MLDDGFSTNMIIIWIVNDPISKQCCIEQSSHIIIDPINYHASINNTLHNNHCVNSLRIMYVSVFGEWTGNAQKKKKKNL